MKSICKKQSRFGVKVYDMCNSQFALGPTTVKALSKARKFFAHLSPGVLPSNPTRGMEVCP
jgi:hypothetical protein